MGLRGSLLCMKRCTYCGKEELDSTLACRGCGTPFPAGDEAQSASEARPRSSLQVSVVTALGVLLLCGAVFFGLGRAVVDMGLVPGKVPAGYKDIYAFVTSMRPAPIILLLAIAPIFWLCQVRCQGRPRTFVTAGLIVFAVGVLAMLPRILPGAAALWCLPGMLAGSGGSPAGSYAGAALQFISGAWLLVWSHPRKNTNAPLTIGN